MPWLITTVFTDAYAPASDAARLLLIAGAISLVFAWTKSLPVSVGKPHLRIVTHGIETAVAVPLTLVLGYYWDATGAAAAVLIATIVFVAAWTVALARLQRQHAHLEAPAA